MDFKDRRSILFLVAAFLVGWAIGLFIFGWLLTPVSYTGAGFQHLREEEQDRFLVTMAELYALTNDNNYIVNMFGAWEGADTAICDLAVDGGANPSQQQKLHRLATILNEGRGCSELPAVAGEQPEIEDASENERSAGTNIALICGLLLVFVAIIGAVFYLWQRRSQKAAEITPPLHL